MICLLDVNVLIALLWPPHEAHGRAQRWFAQNAGYGWATCTMAQVGFVRIVSNPAFSRRAVSALDALAVLSGSLQHPAHQFWTEDIGLEDALSHVGRRPLGHQQITDAFLLGLAVHKKGRMATLDRSLPSLVSEESGAQGRIVLL